jgi:hypothetical protein
VSHGASSDFNSQWKFLLVCVVAIVGGHTAEMLNLLSVLQKERYSPRFYVAAATDNMSLQKARALEDSLADEVHSDRLLCFVIIR